MTGSSLHERSTRWVSTTALAGLLALAACSEAPTRLPQAAPPVRTYEALRSIGTAECPHCLVGPLTLTRTTADPQIATYTFAGDPAADYMLDVTDNGSRGLTGSVKLNGVELVTQSMLGGNGGFHMHQPVSLATDNTLEIRLAGKPGATMTVTLASGVKVIGPNGGSIRSPNGLAVLTVPPGALAAPVELTVGVGGGLPSDADPDLQLATPVITLEPSGTRFAAPVTLTTRPSTPVSEVTELSLQQFHPKTGDLRYLNDVYDLAAGTVSVDTRHFSIFWLLRLRKKVATDEATTWAMQDAPTTIHAAGGSGVAELEADVTHALTQWLTVLSGAGVSFTHDATDPKVRIRALTQAEADDEFLEDPLVAANGDAADGAVMTNVFTRAKQVIINDDLDWTSSAGLAISPSVSAARPFEFVILHEFGHVLGLDHNSQQADPPVMAKTRNSTLPSPLRCEDVRDVQREYKITLTLGRCAATATILSPIPTTSFAGQAVTPSAQVQVLDANGDPMPNVPVIFAVPFGTPGQVVGGIQYTDSNGNAEPTTWTLGAMGTTNYLIARIGYLQPPNAAPLELQWAVTAVAPEVLVYSDDFSNGLGNWIEHDPNNLGTWTTANSELFGNYNISCGSSGCYQLDLVLADTYQQGDGNWRVELQSGLMQAYCCYNGGAMGNIAKFVLYVGDAEKTALETGFAWQGTAVPATVTSVWGSVQRYPWVSLFYQTYTVPAWDPSTWQTATLEKHGSEYILTWNGLEVYRGTHNFAQPPKIGLHTYGAVRLDNFKLYRLP